MVPDLANTKEKKTPEAFIGTIIRLAAASLNSGDGSDSALTQASFLRAEPNPGIKEQFATAA
jgi:hypothetical protein